MIIRDNLQDKGSVESLSFRRISHAGIGAGKDGQSTSGETIINIEGFGFNKILFSTAGHGYWGSRASAVLYGSKDGGATFPNILFNITDGNATGKEVDISEYNCLKFNTIYTAGSYSSGASFENVIMSI